MRRRQIAWLIAALFACLRLAIGYGDATPYIAAMIVLSGMDD